VRIRDGQIAADTGGAHAGGVMSWAAS